MDKGKRLAMAAISLLAVHGLAIAQEQVDAAAVSSRMAQLGLQNVDWGVLLETEAYYVDVGGKQESDIVQATVAFTLEAEASDWLRGQVGLLWEQYSREDDNVDEAFIMLGATSTMPFYLVAGRFYQPVGEFQSTFISDPLTLELMEMDRVAAMAGYAAEWIDVNAGVFRGETKAGYEIDGGGQTNGIGDSALSDYFASIRIFPIDEVAVGAYWLSDLMETYNYGQVGDGVATASGYEKRGAAGAFAHCHLHLVELSVEYASALGNYDLPTGSFTPSALHLECCFHVHEHVLCAIKYEASDDLYAAYDRGLAKFGDKFPGQAYGAMVGYAFHENATISAEYLRLVELDDGEDGHLSTVQLAFKI